MPWGRGDQCLACGPYKAYKSFSHNHRQASKFSQSTQSRFFSWWFLWPLNHVVSIQILHCCLRVQPSGKSAAFGGGRHLPSPGAQRLCVCRRWGGAYSLPKMIHLRREPPPNAFHQEHKRPRTRHEYDLETNLTSRQAEPINLPVFIWQWTDAHLAKLAEVQHKATLKSTREKHQVTAKEEPDFSAEPARPGAKGTLNSKFWSKELPAKDTTPSKVTFHKRRRNQDFSRWEFF